MMQAIFSQPNNPIPYNRHHLPNSNRNNGRSGNIVALNSSPYPRSTPIQTIPFPAQSTPSTVNDAPVSPVQTPTIINQQQTNEKEIPREVKQIPPSTNRPAAVSVSTDGKSSVNMKGKAPTVNTLERLDYDCVLKFLKDFQNASEEYKKQNPSDSIPLAIQSYIAPYIRPILIFRVAKGDQLSWSTLPNKKIIKSLEELIYANSMDESLNRLSTMKLKPPEPSDNPETFLEKYFTTFQETVNYLGPVHKPSEDTIIHFFFKGLESYSSNSIDKEEGNHQQRSKHQPHSWNNNYYSSSVDQSPSRPSRSQDSPTGTKTVETRKMYFPTKLIESVKQMKQYSSLDEAYQSVKEVIATIRLNIQIFENYGLLDAISVNSWWKNENANVSPATSSNGSSSLNGIDDLSSLTQTTYSSMPITSQFLANPFLFDDDRDVQEDKKKKRKHGDGDDGDHASDSTYTPSRQDMPRKRHGNNNNHHQKNPHPYRDDRNHSSGNKKNKNNNNNNNNNHNNQQYNHQNHQNNHAFKRPRS